jgi:hypothetical protein
MTFPDGKDQSPAKGSGPSGVPRGSGCMWEWLAELMLMVLDINTSLGPINEHVW